MSNRNNKLSAGMASDATVQYNFIIDAWPRIFVIFSSTQDFPGLLPHLLKPFRVTWVLLGSIGASIFESQT